MFAVKMSRVVVFSHHHDVYFAPTILLYEGYESLLLRNFLILWSFIFQGIINQFFMFFYS